MNTVERSNDTVKTVTKAKNDVALSQMLRNQRLGMGTDVPPNQLPWSGSNKREEKVSKKEVGRS